MNAHELEQQAGLLRNQGRGYEAVKIYQRAKEAYQQANDLARAAGMQHMIGVAYKIENDIEHALSAYSKAIHEYQEANDLLGEGRVERDIGVMYAYHDKLTSAQEHLLKSKQLLETAPEKAVTANGEKRDEELGITFAKLGLVALRLSQPEKAEEYMINGLATIRKTGHPFYELTALIHLGELYFATKHYDRMLANLEAALGLIYEYGMQHEQTRRLAQIWGLMAHGYLRLDNKETARRFAEKSLNVIKTLSETAARPIEKDIRVGDLCQLLDLSPNDIASGTQT